MLLLFVLCSIKLVAPNHFPWVWFWEIKVYVKKKKIFHNMRQLTFECLFSMFVNILDSYFILKWTFGRIIRCKGSLRGYLISGYLQDIFFRKQTSCNMN